MIFASLNQRRQKQHGSSVIVILALIGIIMICLNVNFAAVKTLQRDVARLDKRQAKYWSQAATATNSPAHE